MLRLCLLALVALNALSDLSEGSTIRVERDACAELLAEFDSCGMNAYADYKAAFEAGDDGRPDWMARKSCNYMTAAVEECGNTLIGDCNSEEDVNEMKDEQLKGILHQLQTSIEEWDSDKCPAVKSHIERMKEDAVDEEETPEADTEDEEAAPEEESAAQEADSEAEPEAESEAEAEVDPEAEPEAEDEAGDAEDAEDAGDAGDAEDAGDSEDEEDEEDEDDSEDAGDAGDEEDSEDAGDAADEEDAEDESEDEDESGSVATTASLSVVMALYMACYA